MGGWLTVFTIGIGIIAIVVAGGVLIVFGRLLLSASSRVGFFLVQSILSFIVGFALNVIVIGLVATLMTVLARYEGGVYATAALWASIAFFLLSAANLGIFLLYRFGWLRDMSNQQVLPLIMNHGAFLGIIGLLFAFPLLLVASSLFIFENRDLLRSYPAYTFINPLDFKAALYFTFQVMIEALPFDIDGWLGIRVSNLELRRTDWLVRGVTMIYQGFLYAAVISLIVSVVQGPRERRPSRQ